MFSTRLFISFGHREPVLLRGNPHWKVLGVSIHVHLPHPSLVFPFLPTVYCGLQRLYRSLEQLYRWVLALTSFVRAVVPLLPGGGTANAQQGLGRLFRPGTAQVSVWPLF